MDKAMTADDIKALVERLRTGTTTSLAYKDEHRPPTRKEIEAADVLETLLAENQRLRLEFRADCEKHAEELFAIGRKLELATQELKNIANANTVEWDDPTQYEAWAKSRARWALGKVDKL
jgi:hypothetical protein